MSELSLINNKLELKNIQINFLTGFFRKDRKSRKAKAEPKGRLHTKQVRAVWEENSG